MKLPPFIAPGSDISVTEEELTERKLKMQKLQEIGIDITRIDDSNERENPYRLQAMCLINDGKDVPLSLMKQIKDFEKKYGC